MSTISGNPSPSLPIHDGDVTVIPGAHLEEKAAELPASKAAEKAARAAAAEAGEDYVPMEGTREESMKRLAQFAWTPSAADVKAAADAAAAAKPENMVKNETVKGAVYFTKPGVDMNGPNTEMYGALVDQINHSQKIHAALY